MGVIGVVISESNRKIIRERFEKMTNPVVVQFYETSLNCPTCPEIHQLLTELSELSELLTLEVFNLYTDEDQAKEHGIDQAPVMMLTNDEHTDFGIRYYGAPSGYEFAALLEDIIMVSQGDSGLSEDTKKQLAALTESVDLAVFVTPT